MYKKRKNNQLKQYGGRFEFTYYSLKTCLEHATDELDSQSEGMYRAMLADLCKRFVQEYDNNLMEFDDEESEEE